MALDRFNKKYQEAKPGGGFPPTNLMPDGTYQVEIHSLRYLDKPDKDLIIVDFHVVDDPHRNDVGTQIFWFKDDMSDAAFDYQAGTLKAFTMACHRDIKLSDFERENICASFEGIVLKATKESSTYQGKNRSDWKNWSFVSDPRDKQTDGSEYDDDPEEPPSDEDIDLDSDDPFGEDS